MRQMTGDILSLGSELFVPESSSSSSSSNQHIKLIQFSSNRLDLKLLSVNENDSGIYTCMFNDEKLTSFLLEIFGKKNHSSIFLKETIRLFLPMMSYKKWY